MTTADFREIGSKLISAFRLSTRPLAVYGSEILPAGIPPMAGVNRCFAVSLFRMATGNEVSGIYVSADTSEGCCLGGLYHVGYIPVPEDIKYFVSTGKKDVRGGAAEYLKASPDLLSVVRWRQGRSTLRENTLLSRHATHFLIPYMR